LAEKEDDNPSTALLGQSFESYRIDEIDVAYEVMKASERISGKATMIDTGEVVSFCFHLDRWALDREKQDITELTNKIYKKISTSIQEKKHDRH